MNIWIVNPYGTLPSEGWREYRSSMLARALAEKGARVRWWISDIEHRSKLRRPVEIIDPHLPNGVNVQVVQSRAYRGNISFGRILYERSFAAGFKRQSQLLDKPDLIVLADPALFFAGSVVEYAKRHKIPIILDVLDLWPELFNILLPSCVSSFGELIFAPLYMRRDRLVLNSAAVTAVTSDYLTQVTRRVKPSRSEVVYLGVDRSTLKPAKSVYRFGDTLELIYAGTLGEAYDMPTLLAAIEAMAKANRPVRFTIAGDGPWRPQVISAAARFPKHIRFLGQVAAETLPDFYADAHVGLATYGEGSTVSMPVKLFDYMAAGLATIGSMQGEASELLSKGGGALYRAGSPVSLEEKIEFYIAHPEILASNRQFSFNKSKEFDQHIQHSRFADLIGYIVRGC